MAETLGNFIRGDVSKLSGKDMKLPEKVQDRAFLGRENESLYRRQIVGIAEVIKKGLIESQGNDNKNDVAVDLLNRNFPGKKTVKEVEDMQNNANLTVTQKENTKRGYERLGKAVYLALKQSGYEDKDLLVAGKVDELLPESFKGIEQEVVGNIIKNENIKNTLSSVNYYKNELDLFDYDQKKEMLSKEVDKGIRDIATVGEKGRSLEENDRKELNKQVSLATAYLTSLKKEIGRNQEDETITDSIEAYIDEHILHKKDVVVDEDLNLRSTKGDVFEKKPGTDEYKDPEMVKWIREREDNASELVKMCTGGEFSSVEEIDEKIKESGMLGNYVRADGSLGEKGDLEAIKDTLGFCTYEAIEKSNIEANRTILGTLNTNRLNKLLANNLKGLGDDVVTNVVTDPFIKSQLKLVCELDNDKSFSLLKLDGGFSGVEDKMEAIKRIGRVVEKLTGSNKMGTDKVYTDEAKRVNTWLIERTNKYNDFIKKQERLRAGLNIPESEEAQSKLARGLMDYVEANGSPPGSLSIMTQVTTLFELTQSEKVTSPDLKAEIGARLNLAFMYYHMHGAGGLLGVRGSSIDDAHEQGYKEGCLLNQDIMNFYFKKGANGLKVAESWDEIEKINFGDGYHKLLTEMVGIDFIKKRVVNGKEEYIYRDNPTQKSNDFWKSIKGTDDYNKFLNTVRDKNNNNQSLTEDDMVVKKAFVNGGEGSQNMESLFWKNMQMNYFVDGNKTRKNIVDRYLKSKIKTEIPIDKRTKDDGYLVDKGYELAIKLLTATGEDSVFNPIFAGHNDFSELILSEANTCDRQKKMKPIGTRRDIHRVVSFATTWPRHLAEMDVFEPLMSKKMDISKMDGGKDDSYFFYCALLPKKVIPVQQFMMKEGQTPKDCLSVETWKKQYDGIDKVIKFGQSVLSDDRANKITIIKKPKDGVVNVDELKHKLRTLEVDSVVVQATNDAGLGWDYASLEQLGDIVTTNYTLIEQAPGQTRETNSFITIEDWNSIYNNEIKNKMRDILEKRKNLEILGAKLKTPR